MKIIVRTKSGSIEYEATSSYLEKNFLFIKQETGSIKTILSYSVKH